MASTVSSATGWTGGRSLASLRPFSSPATAARAASDSPGKSSSTRGPLEHPPDPVDVLVDQPPRPAGLDHRLADILQGHRAEPDGRGRPVQLADEAEGLADVVLLAGRPPVLDVIRLGVAEVGEDQLVDRQRRVGPPGAGRRQQVPGVEPPLGDQAGVLLVALGGAEGPEVVVLAVDGDDGGVTRLVEAVGGRAVGFRAWARRPRRAKTVHVPFFRDLFAAPPTAGGYA